MSDGQVLAMVPNTVSDAEVAGSLRDDSRQTLEAFCKIQARAMANGMRIEFQLGVDMYGRHFIQALNILKVL